MTATVRPTGRYALTARPDGTTVVSFALELEPRGFSRILRPKIRRTVATEVDQLRTLKAVLEK